MACHLFDAKPLPHGILLIEPMGRNFCDVWIKIQFRTKKTFRNVICGLPAIFSLPQCLKSSRIGIGIRSESHKCMHCLFQYNLVLAYNDMLTWTLLKELRMVARALWRSEACRVVPWSEGRSHGTTLSAFDLHNAWVTIPSTFKTKYVNQIQHSRHKSHSQSVQCTYPSHCPCQQWDHNPIQLCDITIALQRTLLRAHVNGTKMFLKSMDQRLNIYLISLQGLIHRYLIVLISRVIR